MKLNLTQPRRGVSVSAIITALCVLKASTPLVQASEDTLACPTGTRSVIVESAPVDFQGVFPRGLWFSTFAPPTRGEIPGLSQSDDQVTLSYCKPKAKDIGIPPPRPYRLAGAGADIEGVGRIEAYMSMDRTAHRRPNGDYGPLPSSPTATAHYRVVPDGNIDVRLKGTFSGTLQATMQPVMAPPYSNLSKFPTFVQAMSKHEFDPSAGPDPWRSLRGDPTLKSLVAQYLDAAVTEHWELGDARVIAGPSLQGLLSFPVGEWHLVEGSENSGERVTIKSEVTRGGEWYATSVAREGMQPFQVSMVSKDARLTNYTVSQQGEGYELSGQFQLYVPDEFEPVGRFGRVAGAHLSGTGDGPTTLNECSTAGCTWTVKLAGAQLDYHDVAPAGEFDPSILARVRGAGGTNPSYSVAGAVRSTTAFADLPFTSFGIRQSAYWAALDSQKERIPVEGIGFRDGLTGDGGESVGIWVATRDNGTMALRGGYQMVSIPGKSGGPARRMSAASGPWELFDWAGKLVASGPCEGDLPTGIWRVWSAENSSSYEEWSFEGGRKANLVGGSPDVMERIRKDAADKAAEAEANAAAEAAEALERAGAAARRPGLIVRYQACVDQAVRANLKWSPEQAIISDVQLIPVAQGLAKDLTDISAKTGTVRSVLAAVNGYSSPAEQADDIGFMGYVGAVNGFNVRVAGGFGVAFRNTEIPAGYCPLASDIWFCEDRGGCDWLARATRNFKIINEMGVH